MPRKKRHYNTRRIKQHTSYYVDEVAALFDVHQNTVLRWIKEGLLTFTVNGRIMIHWKTLTTFLDEKQQSRKHPCQPNEFYCCKCRKPSMAWENAVDILIRNAKQLTITGLCTTCNTKIVKAGSLSKLHDYQRIFTVMSMVGGGKSLQATQQTTGAISQIIYPQNETFWKSQTSTSPITPTSATHTLKERSQPLVNSD